MWKWVLIAGAVGLVWYETEKNKIPLTANRAAAKTINSAGNAVTGIVNQVGPAVGKWLSGLISGGGSSSSSGSSGGGFSGSSYTPDYDLIGDDVEFVDDF